VCHGTHTYKDRQSEHFKSSNWKLNWNFYDRHQDLASPHSHSHSPADTMPVSQVGLTWRMRIVCAHLTKQSQHIHIPSNIPLYPLHINTLIMRFAFVKFPPGPVFWVFIRGPSAYYALTCPNFHASLDLPFGLLAIAAQWSIHWPRMT